MSFWLNKINNVLNTIDDHVETVAEEAPDVVTSAASRARQLLTNRNTTYDVSSGESEEYYDDNDSDGSYSVEVEFNDDLSENGDQNEDQNLPNEDQPSEIHQKDGYGEDDGDTHNAVTDIPKDTKVVVGDFDALEYDSPKEDEPKKDNTTGSNSSSIVIVEMEPGQSIIKENDSVEEVTSKVPIDFISLKVPVISTPKAPISSSSSIPESDRTTPKILNDQKYQQLKDTLLKEKELNARLKSELNATQSETGKLQKQFKDTLSKERELNARLKSELSATQSETLKVQKRNALLEKQLNSANLEMDAQLKELHQAADTMETERNEFKLQSEEMLEEHEEEIASIKSDYEKQILEVKQSFEAELKDLRDRLSYEQSSRYAEQGETTEELEASLSREKEALQKIINLHAEKSSLESTVQKMESQLETLNKDIVILKEAAQTAAKAQNEAEAKLDEALSSHKRQSDQRHSREAELETTNTELGSMLSASQQEVATLKASLKKATTEATINQLDSSYKEKWEVVVEELDNMKSQLFLTSSRCNALQEELDEVSKERHQDASLAQSRMIENDEKLKKLAEVNSSLEATIRDLNGNSSDQSVTRSSTTTSTDTQLRNATNELDQAMRKISTLSDQVIRQQGISERNKSEIVALKGRLQSAVSRAEAAEAQHHQSFGESSDYSKSFELEMGDQSGARSRRRIKGGSSNNRFSQLPTRSISKAVGLRQTNYSSFQKQLAITIDALDHWIIETGGILRHEPLARLGFAVYLIVLHLWCFALFAFHTIEVERHDIKQIPFRGPVIHAGK